MPEDKPEIDKTKTPHPATDPAGTLAEETPQNYDGLPPPGLPKPPGQEKLPA